MDEPMTHDRCSELLPGYVRDGLPREEADQVRTHLAGCAECRAEERAVAATVRSSALDARPLDDMERARLHRGLAQELFTPRTGAAAPTPEAKTWRRWIVPAAAAAALLAGAAVMTLGGGGSSAEMAQISADQGGADNDGGAGAEGRDGVEDSAGSGVKAENKAAPERATESLNAASGAATQADMGGPEEPTPQFFPALGVLTPADLSQIARGHLFQSFVDAYGPEDGPRVYPRFLARISEEAVGIGPEIEECAATLPQDGSLIPAYGALAEYRGERVLVLGFVTHDEDSRRLNRSLLSVWERERCEEPVDTLSQDIDPR